MAEKDRVPVGDALPTPDPGDDTSVDTEPTGAAAPQPKEQPTFLQRVRGVFGKGVPGAKARRRFEFPPERAPEHIYKNEDVDLGDEQLKFSSPEPTPDTSVASHPIKFGFMATVGVGIALLAYFMLQNVGQLLLWILTALFIALGLDPIVRFLERHKFPRPLAIIAVLTVLVGALTLFFVNTIPTIVQQTTDFVNQVPTLTNDFLSSDFFTNIDSQWNVRERIQDEVNSFFGSSSAIGSVFNNAFTAGQAVANGLLGALIVLVLSLYFLASLPAMKRWAYRLAPRSKRNRVQALSEEITRSVGNYVIGQACVALINAGVAFTLMTIFKVPFSALLAFVVALLAFIPLVGGVIAGVLVTLVALTVSPQTALFYAIGYFAYLQVEAYFVSPRIMQKAVAVPGAVAVIAVIAGGSLLGVLGALIAIPTAAAVMLLLKEVFIARQDKL